MLELRTSLLKVEAGEPPVAAELEMLALGVVACVEAVTSSVNDEVLGAVDADEIELACGKIYRLA